MKNKIEFQTNLPVLVKSFTGLLNESADLRHFLNHAYDREKEMELYHVNAMIEGFQAALNCFGVAFEYDNKFVKIKSL